MPEPQTIAKAELQEIKWDNNQQVVELEKKVRVQFNPDSLKVAYTNTLGGGDQGKKAAVQFVSKSTTKLALDLWFDVTVDPDDRAPGAPNDVRLLTREVSYFMTPKKDPRQQNPVPPGVRFAWGSFLFDGIMESLNESLELFSEEGRPLRSKVSISLLSQDIQREIRDLPGGGGAGGANGRAAPGRTPQEPVRQGETVQDVAGRQGQPENWRSIAEANDVDNPRRPPGLLSPGGGR